MIKLQLTACRFLLCLSLFVSTLAELEAGSAYKIQWKQLGEFPIRISEVSLAAIEGKIYAVGGMFTNDNLDLTDNRYLDNTYRYDKSRDQWIECAGMPTPGYDVELIAFNGRLYAISTQNESYDTSTDTWQRHEPLPNGCAHLEGVVAGNKILMYSAEGSELAGQHMAYDPTVERWSALRPIPTPRWLTTEVAKFRDRIYVFGGLAYDAHGHLGPVRNEIEIYDPATDSWKQLQPMPEGIFGACGSGVFDEKIFLIGVLKGENLFESQQTPAVYAYDPQTEGWEHVGDLPHNHGSVGIVLMGNEIYIVGGHDEQFRQFSDVWVGTIEVANHNKQ